jgi:phosphohistidine phosphatase
VHVILVRHAAAVDESATLSDAHRHLTPHGRDQARALGERLRWHDCAPDVAYTSPYVRAVQTAELVLGAMQLDGTAPLEALPALAHGGQPRHVLAALQRLPPDATVLLVGHEPGLSHVADLLLAEGPFPGLSRAMAARIVDGTLRWTFAWDAVAPSKP